MYDKQNPQLYHVVIPCSVREPAKLKLSTLQTRSFTEEQMTIS